MTKQKRGLWLFLFSLFPGAGELYMGFRKQGVSIMILFWSVILIGSWGIPWILFLLPVIWFYSFFNVHNLKSLSEEDFYAVEDHYILLSGDVDFGGISDQLKGKYRTLAAVVLIFIGITILWNNFMDLLAFILPTGVYTFLRSLSYQLPQVVIAIAIILAGLYILSDKKKNLSDNQEDSGNESHTEHFWEPYRPFQQSREPQPSASAPDSAAESSDISAPADNSDVSVPADITEAPADIPEEYPEYHQED